MANIASTLALAQRLRHDAQQTKLAQFALLMERAAQEIEDAVSRQAMTLPESPEK